MRPLLRPFLRLADGQDLIEYALLIGIITVAIVFSIKDTGTTVTGLYADAAAVLSGNSGTGDPEGEPAEPLGGGPGGGDPGGGDPGNGNPGGGNPGNGNPGGGNPGGGNPGGGNPGGGNPGGGNPGGGNPGGGNPGGGKGK